MKLKRLWFIFGLVGLAIIALLLFTDLITFNLFPSLPKISVRNRGLEVTSSITLEEVRNLYNFNTVEYVHRVVFPHDYFLRNTSIDRIIDHATNLGGTAALPPAEEDHFDAWNLAHDVGLNPGRGTDFVVVTVVITAGFNVEGTALAGDSATPGFRTETIATPDGEIRRAIITMPPAAVTKVQVEDIVPENYPYPDISIGADDWRRIAAFVQDQALAMPRIDEVLEIARGNGEAFVREVLTRAGYGDVIFQ